MPSAGSVMISIFSSNSDHFYRLLPLILAEFAQDTGRRTLASHQSAIIKGMIRHTSLDSGTVQLLTDHQVKASDSPRALLTTRYG